MSYYDDIYEIAADNYGVVTTAQAAEAGVPRQQVVLLARRGRLNRIGHGVYRLARWVPGPLDAYADAVALAGPESFIWGESVLAMHGLALVNPPAITVATPRRTRRSLPAGVRAVHVPAGTRHGSVEGIPAQEVADALLACRGLVMAERLVAAVDEAVAQGLVPASEAEELKGELRG